MMKVLMFAIVCLLGIGAAIAQQTRAMQNNAVVITLGNTFQTALPARARFSIEIQNNNTTTDNCWVFPFAGTASIGAAILLPPAGSYQRYSPNSYVPQGPIQVTCTGTNDTMYVAEQ